MPGPTPASDTAPVTMPMGTWRGTAVACLLLALGVGCTGPQPRRPSHAAPAGSSLLSSLAATCAREVPGAQHVVVTTAGHVREQGLGLVGPRPVVRSFAAGEPSVSAAAYCYRWLPRLGRDEWWGVSRSGAAVLIGAFGGETRDLGTFDGAAFD